MKQAAMNLRARLAVLLVASLALPLSVHAQSTEAKLAALEKLPAQERQQKLIEGAKGEGEAVVYANMDVAAMKPLTDGFMKRFPGVKATSVHFSGAAIITRIESESQRGKPLSDVVLSGQLGVLASIEKSIAARYRSPEREVLPRRIQRQRRSVDGVYDQRDGQRIQHQAGQERRAAAHVEDLLKPRWKNKLVMDSQSYVWFGTMMQYLGEEAGGVS